MHKRARLADGGFHRPSDDDNSSSGCSSAGPGALRNMMPSPISPASGRSITGSLYGRPSPTEEQQLPMNRMLSSSRYLPYSIRPLVVRAKRKFQNDSNVHVTSTAQRIINALDNVSTPVVNSAKVPYEPLLTSRPVFTPIRRDNQGPPIMKSPLVPSPQGKIMYNPTIHIPRMVDFGTNTDIVMSTFNSELIPDDNSSSTPRGFGGGKMRSVSTRMHAAPLKQNFSTTVPASALQENQFSFKFAPAVESKFKFSRSWSVNDLKAVQAKKAKDKTTPPAVSNTFTSNQDMFPVKASPAIKVDPVPFKPLSGFVNPNAGKWECPACCSFNDADKSKCACCETPNPKAPAAPKAEAPKNWECPDCMLINKADLDACPACTCKNPNKKSSAPAAVPSTPPKPAFQFGFGAPKTDTPAAKSTPAPATGFVFGAPKDSSTPKSTFTFGARADTPTGTKSVSSAVSTSTPTSSFTFGVPKSPVPKVSESTVTSSADPPKPFTFGAANTSPTKPPISPITFGLPNEPSAATAVKSSPSFSFSSKAHEAAVSPKADIPSKADKLPSVSQPNNVFGSFSFGATKPQVNSTSVIQEEELWQCNKCPARNRVSVKYCIGCSGPKPPVETKTQAASGKRFHFEPFFGGKSEDRTDSYSISEPELKRKIPSASTSFNTSGSSSSTGFMYTPPTETTLKMKAASEAPPPAQAPEMKSGSFLDVLKSGSQFTFAAPAPGASLIPMGQPAQSSSSGVATGSSGSSSLSALPPTLSSSSSVPPTIPSMVSSTSNMNSISSSTSGTAPGPPSGLFQFGASSSTAATNISSTPSMGLPLNNNALNQSTFTFGSSGGGLKNGPLSSSSSAPSAFGSPLGSASPASVFGTPLGGTPSSSSNAPLSTPSGGPALSAPAAPAPSFSFTPNFNFGGPSSASAGSGGFVFQAQPSASPGGPSGDGGMGQRKIRKATRRMQR